MQNQEIVKFWIDENGDPQATFADDQEDQGQDQDQEAQQRGGIRLDAQDWQAHSWEIAQDQAREREQRGMIAKVINITRTNTGSTRNRGTPRRTRSSASKSASSGDSDGNGDGEPARQRASHQQQKSQQAQQQSELPQKLYTRSELAAFFGILPESLSNAISSGKFPRPIFTIFGPRFTESHIQFALTKPTATRRRVGRPRIADSLPLAKGGAK